MLRQWRGQLPEYAQKLDISSLFQEVTLEEYVAIRYPPRFLKRHPDHIRNMDAERHFIQSILRPGDSLYFWTDAKWFCTARKELQASMAGIAILRDGEIVRQWLVWETEPSRGESDFVCARE